MTAQILPVKKPEKIFLPKTLKDSGELEKKIRNKALEALVPEIKNNSQPDKKPPVNLTWEFVKLAISTQERISANTYKRIQDLEQDGETQKRLLKLKKELIASEGKKLSRDIQEEIAALQGRGIAFKPAETAEGLEKQVDLELEEIRFKVKDQYQKIEDQNRDQKMILEITQKVIESFSRFIEKVLGRIKN
ncbi:MAG: hypothetical protein WC371_03560 [Parachlamydiales bacterium]|jgi:hypothetical protein